jgi:UDPglucose 6-dehydrogenase
MKIAVVGDGHLAEATAECCAEIFDLAMSEDAELVWFCADTPVSESDEPNVESIRKQLREALLYVRPGTPVLISSQLPVGTCARFEAEFADHHLAMQPENIRKASAVEDFRSQHRMIVGTRHFEDEELISKVLSRFTRNIYFMSPESAEMTKHALNAYLAMCIAFANEISDLAEMNGADPSSVFLGFRSDQRVGNGPLMPGGPYRGGTLGRDVRVLIDTGAGPLIRGVSESNGARL